MRQLNENGHSSLKADLRFKTQSTISTDFAVEMFFSNQYPKSKTLQKWVYEKEEKYPQIRELIFDIYNLLTSYYPLLNKENEMLPTHLLNFAAVKALIEHENYIQLRNIVDGDELMGLISTEVLLKDCFIIIESLEEKFAELQEKYEHSIEAAKAMLATDEEAASYDELQKKFDELREELEASYAESINSFDFTKQVSFSIDQISQEQKTCKIWGLGNDGTFQKMPYDKKIGILDKLKSDEKVKKVALLAGKLRALLHFGKDTISKENKTSVTNVSIGNDLSTLLPDELLRFIRPETRGAFYKDYTDQKLKQYELGSKVKKGEGHIIALIDVSSSMAGVCEIWSKAVAMALLDIARKKKRSFVAVHFDSGVKSTGLHANYFTKKKPYSIEQVIDMAEYFSGGGTEFQPSLDRAREEISTEAEFTKADIIMITDGQSFVSDEWLKTFLEWKTSKKVNVFTIIIGKVDQTTVKKFSDTVVELDHKSIAEGGMDVASMLFKQLIWQKMVTLDLTPLNQILPPDLITRLNGKTTTELYLSWPIKKKSGKLRWIDAPMEDLKKAQEILLTSVLYTFEPHEAAVGFRPGIGIIAGPKKHYGAAVLLNIDLKDFFNSIKQLDLIWASAVLADNIIGLNLTSASNDRVATAIRNLCLFKGRLPQGAPTSPAMSNIVCYDLDKKLTEACKTMDVTYSRYADDMTFSSKDKNLDMGMFLVKTILPVLKEYSFAIINPEKTRILRRHKRMTVTGVVINDKFGIPKWKLKNFRAHLHNLKCANDPITKTHYQKLLGYVTWIMSLNSTTGQKYLALLEEIPVLYKPQQLYPKKAPSQKFGSQP